MSSARKIGVIVLFWLAVGLIQTFNWGNGAPKAVVMLLVLAAAPLAIRAAQRTPQPLGPIFGVAVSTVFWLFLVLDVIYFGARIIAPHVIDIATTTLAAGQAVLHGTNPYALPIDTGPESAGFSGYKYMPMMIVDYLPLGAPLGARGILLTNLALLLGCLAVMKRVTGMQGAGTRLAPLLLVMLPLLAEQIFAKGATDLAAVLPLLVALALVECSSFWCGVGVGLSIATKLLPGVAMLPALIPGQRRGAFVAGVVVGLVPILPFLIAGPQSFWDNIVLFNLTRLPDDTAWLHALPPAVAGAAHLVFAAAIAIAAFYVWSRKPGLAARSGLAAMLGLAAILAGPGAHHNYQLWWLPFYALLLSATLAPNAAFLYINSAKFDPKGA